jgi:hypothetical protein
MTHPTPDPNELLDALASGVLPGQLPDWDRATSVLPVFDLCRSLFSTSPADTTLKLVILLALSKAEGRFSRERIRTLVPHLDPAKLDLLVTSLYKGGWLHLRATDNTYRVPPLAFLLLNLLVAANFVGQTPANMLVRAVETVAFGDRIDGESTGHLLALLLAELETQAELARRVLAEGTPRQLIRFSRQEVRDQILHVGQVISTIEERIDASSGHFALLVRIHEALQAILRAHVGLGRRLAEWNLKRLETSEAGYSLTALSDAVLGSTEDEMIALVRDGVVRFPAPAVCLVTRRLLTRHRTTRPSLDRERAAFAYQPPPEPAVGEVALAEVDPLERLRERVLAAVEAGRSITEALLEDVDDFLDAVYQLNLLARIEGRGPSEEVELALGIRIRLSIPVADPGDLRELSTAQALERLVDAGILVSAGALGLHPRLEVTP